MLIALLIIARTAHIGSTILLVGTFTFERITLSPVRQPDSDDFRKLDRRFLPPTLLLGPFSFDRITLTPVRQPDSDDFRKLDRRLLRLARWSLVVAFLSAL